MKQDTTRIGYYVEGKFFGTKIGQARGLAQHRAKEFSRPVEVTYVDHTLKMTVIDTCRPDGQVVEEVAVGDRTAGNIIGLFDERKSK